MAANVVEDVRENLELQLSEVEMLRSMYPEENELKIGDQVLIDIQEFCSRRTNKTPNGLNFLLTVTVDCDSEMYFIELSCYFPQEYPHEKPEIFARSQTLNREIQKELNDDLNVHISTLDRGELCTLPTIQWVKDNGELYIAKNKDLRSFPLTEKNEDTSRCKSKKDTSFLRMWLYIHSTFTVKQSERISSNGLQTTISLVFACQGNQELFVWKETSTMLKNTLVACVALTGKK